MPITHHSDSVITTEMGAGVSSWVHKGMSGHSGKRFWCWQLLADRQSLNFKCSFVLFEICFLLGRLAQDMRLWSTWVTPLRLYACPSVDDKPLGFIF